MRVTEEDKRNSKMNLLMPPSAPPFVEGSVNRDH